MRVLRPIRVTHLEDKVKESSDESGVTVINGDIVNGLGDEVLTKTSVGRDQSLLEAADANAIEEVNLAYEVFKEIDCLDVNKERNDAWETAMKQ